MQESGIMISKDVENITDAQVVLPMQSSKNWLIVSNSVLLVVLFAVTYRIFYNQNHGKAIGDAVSAVCFFMLVFAGIEISLRVYHLCMELPRLDTKYENDVGKILTAWNLNALSWISIALSLFLFMILQNTNGNTISHVWSFGPTKCLSPIFISILLCQIIGLKDSTLNKALEISSMGGLDYGTGMAYSYFYGYLQLILPSDGGHYSGLYHKMEEYEAVQNVSILVKKLFILIPESGHIPPDLKEASYHWLESTTALENERRDRAGVKGRIYKNTVYKIHPGGNLKLARPVYVTTEGATPMLTLWELLKHSHPETAAYREHRHEIIASFYRTLQTLLLNDPNCRDVCELVYYKDYDAQGKKVNVGEILLRRILSYVPSSAMDS